MKEIKTFEEYQKVEKEKCSVILFYTKWCPLCKKVKFSLYELCEIIDSINFYLVDISDESEINRHLKIKSTPTLLIYQNGNLIDNISGFIEFEDLEERLLSFRP